MLRSSCTVYYDKAHDRLVYLGRAADEDYWDGHWLATLTAEDIRRADRFVVGVTKRYLPAGTRVVDAGCGLARTVFGLGSAGFDAYGVDYAPETVSTINRLVPELKITLGDVRDLSQFESAFFDGVWSLGVIEHFYDGYRQILFETSRILKLGGYAFVTVPSMSPLRKIKAAVGAYPTWQSGDHSSFYQFALSPNSIVKEFRQAGFELVASENRGGFKGLKDESGLLTPLLQKVYDSKRPAVRLLRAALDRVLGPLSFHTKLYVFRKTAEGSAA